MAARLDKAIPEALLGCVFWKGAGLGLIDGTLG